MIRIYRKTALMRAVRYDGTDASAEEIIGFMRDHRGVLTDEQGNKIGRHDAGWIDRSSRWYMSGGMGEEQFEAHRVLFQDPKVKAVIWNDLHKYWNPLRLADHVALDSQGCFYPIADADVLGSYTEVGEK